MKSLFDEVSMKCSKLVTTNYSTSFSLGIRALDRRFHPAIYAIYGFVRCADEIVDSFHDFDKQKLLTEFEADTYEAIERGISLNPILNSFQATVNQYSIEKELIDTFLRSMEMDLYQTNYDQKEFEQYILGSAEVVGLMCLRVFCEGDKDSYNQLKFNAMRLGSAFQKINFLRDLNADFKQLGRSYFPNLNTEKFDEQSKKMIVQDIEKDFKDGLEGIKGLPQGAKFGVYVAYVYYYALFRKIQNTQSNKILTERIRISNKRKCALMLTSYFKYSMGRV